MFAGAENFLGVRFIVSRFLARSVPIEVRSDQDVGGDTPLCPVVAEHPVV